MEFMSHLKKPPVKANRWCYTANEGEMNFSFAWSIENFSQKMKLYKNKEYLTSDTFEVEIDGKKTAWCLICYPNGSIEASKGSLGLYLRITNEAFLNRNLSFSSEVVDTKKLKGIKRTAIHSFPEKGSDWGWASFATHDKLESVRDNLLPKGILTILCVLTFGGTDLTTSGRSSQPNSTIPLDTMSEEYEAGLDVSGLLETGYMADVELVCEGKTFSCHKNILGSRSPFFRAALEHNMKEKASGKITINNIDKDTVADMLTHIYGGKIEGIENKADNLLAAADQYDLKQLKKYCEELLARSLDISNCLDCLILADLYSSDRLKPVVTGFILENLTDVGAQDKWRKMQATHPGIFLDLFNEIASKHLKK